EDEPAREDDRQQEEDPLRLAAQAREEHRLLDGRRSASGGLLTGPGLGLRGLPPRLCCSSRHGLLGYLGAPDETVAVPLGRAARPLAVSSVAAIASCYCCSLR